MAIHDDHRDIVARLVHRWRRMGFLQEKDRQRLLNSLNIMRMICDSTYILDQETNHQTKLDELFNILDELFAMKGEKVVIFSQWERMTRLVGMGLRARKIGFESLHGGVPSQQREALFTNFNSDPECRVFLSTDAGGVGLNLQAAAYMINLDIPWNPAVLEQRIARIYRMGQKKNVSIINIIAKNTIEEKMLEILKFKSSVAAGVLDNGEDSIFLGDSKFKKLMETVEAITVESDDKALTYFDKNEKSELATSGAPQTSESEVVGSKNKVGVSAAMNVLPDPQDLMAHTEHSLLFSDDTKAQKTVSGIVMPENRSVAASMGSTEQLTKTWTDFFTELVNTLKQPDGAKNLARSITEKDETTGKTYLKLAVDKQETIENAINMIAGFLKG